jgi:ribose/xylose/arabinose/galactoside ABC-type transport system permease subunit
LDADVAARVAMLVVVFGIFAIVDPRFATSGDIYAAMEGFAFAGAVALGVGVTIIAGEFDLSVGSVAGLCGVIAVSLSGLGLYASVAIAVAIALAFGLLQGAAIAWLRISSLVFTIGTLVAVRGVAFIVAHERTVVLPFDKLTYSDAIQNPIGIFSPFSLITVALFIVVGLLLAYSRYGREIFAFGGGRNEALAAGVSRFRPLILAFGLSAMLAGFSGAMLSIKSGSAPPSAYDTLLLPAVTAALIGGTSLSGGRGSVIGIAAGVLTLRFLLNELSLNGLPYFVESLSTGLLLLLVLAIEVGTGRLDLQARLREIIASRRQPAVEGSA